MQSVQLIARDTHQNVGLIDRAAAAVAPTITTTALPNGFVGAAYSQTLQVSGSAPFTFTFSGSLPAGLSFNATTRTISGTSVEPVNAQFTIRATNSAGSNDKALSIVVPNEGVGSDAPVVTTVTLVPAAAEVAQGETVDLLATVEDQNGNPIPNIDGLAASTNEGAATVALLGPTDEFGQATARVTPGLDSGTVNISVSFDGVTSNPSAVTVTMAAVAPTITTTTLPQATVGTAYSAQLAATGTPPLSYAVTSGALPAGLTLSAGGLVSGTPTGPAGTVAFTATVANPAGTDDQAFSLVVAAAGAVTGVSVSPDSQTIDVAGQAQFTVAVLGTGGFSSAVTWSVVSGGGVVSASGLYTAPGSATTATVRATSVQDPTKFDDSTVTVQVPGVDVLHIPGIRIAAWVGSRRTLPVRLTTTGGSEGLVVTATSSDPAKVAVTPSAITNPGGIATFTVDFLAGGTAVLSFAGEGMTGELLAVARTQE